MEGCSTFQCRGEGFCFSDEGTSSLVGGGGGIGFDGGVF